jgi:hypothetical protein
MSRIFIRNKYTKWYLSIVKKANNRSIDQGTYYEKHHILPASIFPKYKNLKKYQWNCVYLTAKEHFIVHCLLIRMTKLINKRKMLYALKCMKMNKTGKRYSSRLYDFHRKDISKAISENNRGHSWNKGHIRTYEQRQKLKKSFALSSTHTNATSKNLKKATLVNTGKPRPEHLKKQWSEKHKGIPKSEEIKRKMSESRKGKTFGPRPPYQKTICPHCQKEGIISNMKRWHFDNCKNQVS